MDIGWLTVEAISDAAKWVTAFSTAQYFGFEMVGLAHVQRKHFRLDMAQPPMVI